jgi:hypothetical protein
MAKKEVELQPLRDGEVIEAAPERQPVERPSPLLMNGNPFHSVSRVIPVCVQETTQSIGPGKEVKIRTGLTYNQSGRVGVFTSSNNTLFIVDSLQELIPGQEVVVTLKNVGMTAWKGVPGAVVAGMAVVEAEKL